MFQLVCLAYMVTAVAAVCKPTITTASGKGAPTGTLCSNQLIFSEQFAKLNSSLWKHEVSLQNANGEFEWYTADSKNSFIKSGALNIMPSLTTDSIPDLTKCNIHIASGCTGSCDQVCSATNIAPPVKSARLTSFNGFRFKYGKVEIRAKLPTGNWLWPALWLMPYKSVYGGWPRSGEIDVMESRGNTNLNGQGLGPESIGSTLHFGTQDGNSAWQTAHYDKKSASGQGFNKGYHLYQFEWTPDHIKFSVDNQEIGSVVTGDGFYKRGKFTGPNPWAKGGKNAPFDEEFYFILNTAVGATNGYFPDNVGGKPWKNSAPYAKRDFWNGRNQWKSTYNFDPAALLTSAMQVDYITVRAI